MSCPVHDKWEFHRDCECPPERKWARKQMLQETLEKIAQPPTPTPLSKQEEQK